jgi:hypothetical protein
MAMPETYVKALFFNEDVGIIYGTDGSRIREG